MSREVLNIISLCKHLIPLCVSLHIYFSGSSIYNLHLSYIQPTLYIPCPRGSKAAIVSPVWKPKIIKTSTLLVTFCLATGLAKGDLQTQRLLWGNFFGFSPWNTPLHAFVVSGQIHIKGHTPRWCGHKIFSHPFFRSWLANTKIGIFYISLE